MKYLSKEEYEKQLKLIKRKNQQKKYRVQLKQAKSDWKPPKEKLETSKQIAIYLFIILNVVIVYCLIAMWWFADLSCLSILISDIAAQILIYGIYCLKAYKAKKSSENMKFRREKLQGLDEIMQAGAESTEYVPVNGDVTVHQHIVGTDTENIQDTDDTNNEFSYAGNGHSESNR